MIYCIYIEISCISISVIGIIIEKIRKEIKAERKSKREIEEKE